MHILERDLYSILGLVRKPRSRPSSNVLSIFCPATHSILLPEGGIFYEKTYPKCISSYCFFIVNHPPSLNNKTIEMYGQRF